MTLYDIGWLAAGGRPNSLYRVPFLVRARTPCSRNESVFFFFLWVPCASLHPTYYIYSISFLAFDFVLFIHFPSFCRFDVLVFCFYALVGAL